MVLLGPPRARSYRKVLTGSAIVFLTVSTVLWAKDSLTHTDRLLLIRSLDREIAVAKLPMPAGKHGIRIDANGQVDQSYSQKQLREYGPAIRPGAPVEITAIKFKPNRIILELNGGHHGEHWYQHIEFGMGYPQEPMLPTTAPVLAAGSYISLAIPGDVSKLTSDQVKNLLVSALDFSRHSPTALYSPQEPPQFKEAIKKHQAVVGMDRDSVLSAKGPPIRKVRYEKDGSELEDWIYGDAPHCLFVTFNGDQVVKIEQY
ncbi:MAG: hypothetical protein ACRD3T_03990 [Terriglobia bacterium]